MLATPERPTRTRLTSNNHLSEQERAVPGDRRPGHTVVTDGAPAPHRRGQNGQAESPTEGSNTPDESRPATQLRDLGQQRRDHRIPLDKPREQVVIRRTLRLGTGHPGTMPHQPHHVDQGPQLSPDELSRRSNTPRARTTRDPELNTYLQRAGRTDETGPQTRHAAGRFGQAEPLPGGLGTINSRHIGACCICHVPVADPAIALSVFKRVGVVGDRCPHAIGVACWWQPQKETKLRRSLGAAAAAVAFIASTFAISSPANAADSTRAGSLLICEHAFAGGLCNAYTDDSVKGGLRTLNRGPSKHPRYLNNKVSYVQNSTSVEVCFFFETDYLGPIRCIGAGQRIPDLSHTDWNDTVSSAIGVIR